MVGYATIPSLRFVAYYWGHPRNSREGLVLCLDKIISSLTHERMKVIVTSIIQLGITVALRRFYATPKYGANI